MDWLSVNFKSLGGQPGAGKATFAFFLIFEAIVGQE